MTTLTLIRGLPGSGKSTLAKALLVAQGKEVTKHFEADMFFEKDGPYKWDGMKIGEAHEWCQFETSESLFYKFNVIVSNTFTRCFEMESYIDMAREHNAKLQIVLCQGNFGSIHGVPEKTLKHMAGRFEYNISTLGLK